MKIEATRDLEGYEELFNEYFVEFEASGYDTVVLTDMSSRFLMNNIQRRWYAALPEEFTISQAIRPNTSKSPTERITIEVDESQARYWIQELVTCSTPSFQAGDSETYRKCRKNHRVMDYDVEWRLFLEYTLRRIPQDDTTLRELLMERVRHMWTKQRREDDRKHNIELVKRLGEELNKVFNRAINTAIYELIAHNVIESERIEPFLGDKDEVSKPVNRLFDFGIVQNDVLLWIKNLKQLACVIQHVQRDMGLEDVKPYEMMKRVEASGKVILAEGSFDSVKTYLQQLRNDAEDFESAPYVFEATKVVAFLLKLSSEFYSENHS
jgi:hypothetical protein